VAVVISQESEPQQSGPNLESLKNQILYRAATRRRLSIWYS